MLSDTCSQKSQIAQVLKTYLGPESFWNSIILHAYCNILYWNNKNIFHQIQVVLIISRKYSTNASQSPPRCWWYINIHFISNCRGTISYIAKFPAWAFRFQLSSFFRICVESVNEIDMGPSV